MPPFRFDSITVFASIRSRNRALKINTRFVIDQNVQKPVHIPFVGQERPLTVLPFHVHVYRRPASALPVV